MKCIRLLVSIPPTMAVGKAIGIIKQNTSRELKQKFPFLKQVSFVSKVVIPVKTGIQVDIIRHDFWIPTCVGMTKRLKTALMIQAYIEDRGKKCGANEV